MRAARRTTVYLFTSPVPRPTSPVRWGSTPGCSMTPRSGAGTATPVNLLAGLAAPGIGWSSTPTGRSTRTTWPPAGEAIASGRPADADVAWEQRWLPRRVRRRRGGRAARAVPLRPALVEPLPAGADPARRHRAGLGRGAAGLLEAAAPPGRLAVRASCWSPGPGPTGSSPSATTRRPTWSAAWACRPGDRVTYEAADPRFHAPVAAADRRRVRRRHGLAGPYVFYVGGWEGRKNVPFLVAGLRRGRLGRGRPGPGRRPRRRSGRAAALAAGLGVADRLRLLGWVEDADLPALYAERWASSTRASTRASASSSARRWPSAARPWRPGHGLPEVLGDGGETFGLDDPAELVAALRRLAADPAIVPTLAARARARAADFSWRRIAEQTLEVYRSALGPTRRMTRTRGTGKRGPMSRTRRATGTTSWCCCSRG